MKWKKLGLVLFFVGTLSACKSGAPASETVTPSEIETSVQITKESSAESTIEETVTLSTAIETIEQNTDTEPATKELTLPDSETEPSIPVSETDPSKPTLTWAYIDLVPINDTAKELIAQVLEKKGIECNIEYVSTSILDVKGYPSWVKNQRETGHVPDILHTSFWYHGVYDFADFAQDELLPLNDYLESDEGKELREAYSEAEWRRASFGEMIYTTPFRSGGEELYYFVNNKYIKDFEADFDGTYQSLKKILEKHSESDLCIGAGNFGDEIGAVWLGYERDGTMLYEFETGRIVDITREPKVKEMLQLIYSDLQSGQLIINPKPELIKKEKLVYVARMAKPEMEGFTAYRMEPDTVHTGFDYFGISKYSSQKELALQVLAAVYCDPRIASLIDFRREDPEGWLNQAEYIKNNLQESPVMGFVADLSLEQREALNDYYDTIYPLFFSMIDIAGGRSDINQLYLKLLDETFDNPKDYGDVFDAINCQMEEWLENHKE